MKKLKSHKRNTLAVRLEDEDYYAFLDRTGRNYSQTLRMLIKRYNQETKPHGKNR